MRIQKEKPCPSDPVVVIADHFSVQEIERFQMTLEEYFDIKVWENATYNVQQSLDFDKGRLSLMLKQMSSVDFLT